MIFTLNAVQCDNKVAAIKGVRTLTGRGLKEAKDTVESSMEGKNIVLQSLISTNEETKLAIKDAISLIRQSGCTLTKCAKGGKPELKKMIKHAVEVEEFDLAIDLMQTFQKFFGDEDDLS